jgi:hypothetical protein
MSAPDIFALGGRQGDPILPLETERQQIDAKLGVLCDAGILDSETEREMTARIIALEDQIAASTPVSIGGAIAVIGQLKRLSEFEWDEAHDKLVENLLAGLRRLADAGDAV